MQPEQHAVNIRGNLRDRQARNRLRRNQPNQAENRRYEDDEDLNDNNNNNNPNNDQEDDDMIDEMTTAEREELRKRVGTKKLGIHF